jgi:rhodanese-related sulfurtransferase
MPVPRISCEQLNRRLTGGVPPLIFDVRLKYPYEHSTVLLPGAVRCGPAAVDHMLLSHDRDIVLYDSDPAELVAEGIAVPLLGDGYRVFVLQGGISQWIAAKLPTDRKPAPQLAVPVTSAAKA